MDDQVKLNFEGSRVLKFIGEFLKSDKRILILRGGTRSTKTYSVIQAIWTLLYTRENLTIDVGRKSFPSLKATVLKDFLSIGNDHGIYNIKQHNRTDQVYKNKSNEVWFFSMDDESKLRGRTRDILYLNEVNEFTWDEFRQFLFRTKEKIIIDFNPDDEDIWINTELEQKRMITEKDVMLNVSNYKNNPFLNKDQVREIEYLENTDPAFWKIYGLGEYGKISGLIYEFNIVDELPKDFKKRAYGLDFGYTNDPTSLVEIRLSGGELWIDELIYQTGLTNEDLDLYVSESGMGAPIKIDKNSEIIADSAEPKSIEELYRKGWNIKGATKGKDSINNGIQVLKQYKINVTARSINTIKEFKHYKWAEDKNGNPINKPIDSFNHAMDALRYGVQGITKPRTHGIRTIKVNK